MFVVPKFRLFWVHLYYWITPSISVVMYVLPNFLCLDAFMQLPQHVELDFALKMHIRSIWCIAKLWFVSMPQKSFWESFQF